MLVVVFSLLCERSQCLRNRNNLTVYNKCKSMRADKKTWNKKMFFFAQQIRRQSGFCFFFAAFLLFALCSLPFAHSILFFLLHSANELKIAFLLLLLFSSLSAHTDSQFHHSFHQPNSTQHTHTRKKTRCFKVRTIINHHSLRVSVQHTCLRQHHSQLATPLSAPTVCFSCSKQ